MDAAPESSSLPAQSSAPSGTSKPKRGKRNAKSDPPAPGKVDRRGKRARGRETADWTSKRDKGEGNEDEGDDKKERLPKRKCAVLVGFCGTGYSGMQFQATQKDTKTIEGDLFDALVKAGAVSSDNSDDPTKVSLGRAARTDAGVHAAGNIVSLKLINEIPELHSAGISLVDHVNSFLPPQIRVWQILRTTNNFNTCDSRIYEYLFPSYILMPPHPASQLGARLARSSATSDPDTPTSEPSIEELDELHKKFRATPDQLARFQEVLKQFEGTHNFHNYTVGRPFSDKAAARYMIKLEVREPRVEGDFEWVSVQFHGQSFMLHQVRKMIGMVMLVARTSTPATLIPETFGPSRIHIPRAPALGLLLEQPRFSSYNTKTEQSNAQIQKQQSEAPAAIDIDEAQPEAEGAGKKPSTNVNDVAGIGGATIKEPIDFEPHRETIEVFKRDHIYAAMRAEEASNHVFSQWITSVDRYAGSDFDYLNAEGTIPASAVMKKGKGDTFAEAVEDEPQTSMPRTKMDELEG
ncbi:tRNA pseudouridine synthase [Clavulina sp. PMI_390]|nr:tRNA pseudouridine synthase [Clavulina sp. PMI_390]